MPLAFKKSVQIPKATVALSWKVVVLVNFHPKAAALSSVINVLRNSYGKVNGMATIWLNMSDQILGCWKRIGYLLVQNIDAVSAAGNKIEFTTRSNTLEDRMHMNRSSMSLLTWLPTRR